MSFPSMLLEVGSIAKHFNGAKKALEVAQSSLECEMEMHRKRWHCNHSEIADLKNKEYMLEGLLGSWKEPYPSLSYFFLNSRFERVVVRSLLEPNSRAYTAPEWESCQQAGKKVFFRDVVYDHIPPQIPIVSFDAVAQNNCAHCNKTLPVIEEVKLVNEDPDGEEWRRRHILFCFGGCNKETVLLEESL